MAFGGWTHLSPSLPKPTSVTFEATSDRLIYYTHQIKLSYTKDCVTLCILCSKCGRTLCKAGRSVGVPHDVHVTLQQRLCPDRLVIRPMQKEQLTTYVIDRCNVRSTLLWKTIKMQKIKRRTTRCISNKKAVLSQGNRAMPQLFFSV